MSKMTLASNQYNITWALNNNKPKIKLLATKQNKTPLPQTKNQQKKKTKKTKTKQKQKQKQNGKKKNPTHQKVGKDPNCNWNSLETEA